MVLGLNWPRELGMFVLTQAGVGIPPVRPGRRGTTPPLGLEAKSLKKRDDPLLDFKIQGPFQTNKQTKYHF